MPTSNALPEVQWQALFLQLIGCLQQDPQEFAHRARDDSAKEVVVEMRMGGFVYVLSRCPSGVDEEERVTFSRREQEIIRLVCAGLPNKAISDVLEISPWTVATYLKRIFAKLSVGSRAEMVARVLKEDLLDWQDGRG